jgi:hypothetical protein
MVMRFVTALILIYIIPFTPPPESYVKTVLSRLRIKEAAISAGEFYFRFCDLCACGTQMLLRVTFK